MPLTTRKSSGLGLLVGFGLGWLYATITHWTDALRVCDDWRCYECRQMKRWS